MDDPPHLLGICSIRARSSPTIRGSQGYRLPSDCPGQQGLSPPGAVSPWDLLPLPPPALLTARPLTLLLSLSMLRLLGGGRDHHSTVTS